MGRIFRRGELKEAIVAVLDTLDEAHGYAIMGELKERVGGGWKPSPGAIYPALLALVETGHVETLEREGTRMYALTEAGRRAARSTRSESRWASLPARAETGTSRIAVGSLLDRFAAESSVRRRLAEDDQQTEIRAILERAHHEIEQVLTKGDDDG